MQADQDFNCPSVYSIFFSFQIEILYHKKIVETTLIRAKFRMLTWLKNEHKECFF